MAIFTNLVASVIYSKYFKEAIRHVTLKRNYNCDLLTLHLYCSYQCMCPLIDMIDTQGIRPHRVPNSLPHYIEDDRLGSFCLRLDR